MKKTVYEINSSSFSKNICFAVVSDLHGRDPQKVIELLKEESPDYILMPGDILEKLDGENNKAFENGYKLLCEAAEIAPTFYSTGNHEDGATRSWSPSWKKRIKQRVYDAEEVEKIKKSEAIMLDDEFVRYGEIAFGGLSSGLINEGGIPNTKWLDEFCSLDMPKVLLCHHPEYYETYLRERNIDLIVSGHAHGGQWRFFGRGVFAPGQGVFPKYTYGVHDNRFVISTGLKTGKIPRFFNPPEVVFVKIKHKKTTPIG